MENDSEGFVTRLQTWALYPITNQMDLLSVVLTVILVTTVAAAWYMVFNHLAADVGG